MDAGLLLQMRSLASETGRELALRVRRDVNLSYWLSWQAVDFGEELSALSARLLVSQQPCFCGLQAPLSDLGMPA